MDVDQQTRQFKVLLIFVVAFLVSAVYSYKEMKYYLWGRTAAARVIEVKETTAGRRRSPALEVRYAYTDETGLEVRDSDTVSTNWSPPEGQGLRIQYLAGASGTSRLAGHTYPVAVIVFSVSLLCILFFAGRLWLDTRKAVAEKRQFESRRRR